MSHQIINPAALHDPVRFGYSHVADTSTGLVFIAGQYASDGDGEVTSADFAEQVEKSLANLRTALAAVDLDFSHVVQLRTYVVDHDLDKLAVIGRLIGEIWGDQPPTQTLTGVAALALPGMLFEIDAVAVRP
ncbi:Enamine deaminase RidA, house cleaning of reactive enamine intermediates, YjgF/YER057c/UK114 family [Saccharopolyspora kobensis]|uniref:Enamine deaminase RidA, house cleaning of reactive enamine intermediates, YjgF/YER057c/UK114 family n=1 Tax=Saccharopolyspora kobensis TaxID=146035 RepID=A0A1H6DBZ8_9PSEU|nr:RidA family protein [Saccharopolyspora kobensis]SEG82682.1 Enamine deaminase RidA, house cleaning of reactive enamine intermediates, YjgF/YER057c/UK114 family [Saccharopolyspora kobensis]SFE25663.1 Enamine deaminase RidA, house cleaning of reactive enamine intermediates, YjgF/YER057c/UK114 family [Saccharopolyspora kobensis]